MPNIEVTNLTPIIGAEITGPDFSVPLDHQLAETVYQLLIEHQVIFFRNQTMTPEMHIALAESLGEPEEPHPVYPQLEGHPSITVLNFGPENPPDVDTWHTNVTFRGIPPFASILYSRVIPPYGGDTIWVSMTEAYEALPDGMKADLAELRAVHDLGDFRNDFIQDADDGTAHSLIDAHRKFGSAIHPMVKTHPVTGRRFLFCNPAFTVHVEGMTATDSTRLLNYLFDHLRQPEFQVRFRWTENSIAIWDNRCTVHYALADYAPHCRIMNRVTVINDRRSDETVTSWMARSA